MRFNVNDTVRVKLTPTGKDILRKKFESTHERMPQVFKEFTLPKEDEHGFSKWQMWSLFADFGEYIGPGFEPPFETEIEIVENAATITALRTMLKRLEWSASDSAAVFCPECQSDKPTHAPGCELDALLKESE